MSDNITSGHTRDKVCLCGKCRKYFMASRDSDGFFAKGCPHCAARESDEPKTVPDHATWYDLEDVYEEGPSQPQSKSENTQPSSSAATCGACGHEVKIMADGRIQLHNTRGGLNASSNTLCSGSGKSPLETLSTGTCGVCDHEVEITLDGRIRLHNTHGRSSNISSANVCNGSGLLPQPMPKPASFRDMYSGRDKSPIESSPTVKCDACGHEVKLTPSGTFQTHNMEDGGSNLSFDNMCGNSALSPRPKFKTPKYTMSKRAYDMLGNFDAAETEIKALDLENVQAIIDEEITKIRAHEADEETRLDWKSTGPLTSKTGVPIKYKEFVPLKFKDRSVTRHSIKRDNRRKGSQEEIDNYRLITEKMMKKSKTDVAPTKDGIISIW